MPQPRILVFAGSARRDSYNKKLARIAAKLTQEAGAQVTLLDFADLPMPLYDGDFETQSGVPENAIKFKDLLKSHDGFIIASPENNSSYSALLKNVIDWASRPIPGEPPLGAFVGKFALLISASPGALGGLRGLISLRTLLSNIQVTVLPDQLTVSAAHEAFDDSGALRDPKKQATLAAACKRLTDILSHLKS
jgi:NAD(P)H-dependent FMN reductase